MPAFTIFTCDLITDERIYSQTLFSIPGNSGMYIFIPEIPKHPGMTFTAVLLAPWRYEKLSVSPPYPVRCCCRLGSSYLISHHTH